MARRKLSRAALRYRLATLGTYAAQEGAVEDAVATTQRAVLGLLTEKPLTLRDLPGVLRKLDALIDDQEQALLAAVEDAMTEAGTATATFAKPA